MNFEIKNRFTGDAIFTTELEAHYESEPHSIQLGAAVKLAVKARANLADANLAGANLAGTNLAGTNLADGVKIRDDIVVKQAPICISGLTWFVTIWDQHMQIGCEFHSHDQWRAFDTEAWMRMGGKAAIRLRDAHLGTLMALCDAHAAKVTSGDHDSADAA